MLRLLLQSVLCLAMLTFLTGLVYPLVVTGVAEAVFPHQAHGSLITHDGRTVGSELIGQAFSDPRYFWSRPSATSDANSKPLPYNAGSSGGSNLGPTNPDLGKQVKERVAALRAADPGNTQAVPVDLVTASASGLDPDISPAAAEFQVPRVARARGLAETAVRDLVRQHTHERFLGVLGEPRVSVLQLNLALDDPAR
ncbi:MAG: potassium-transporting ATPase subunit KdpC [Planctomycetota bacterium]|nr:potassium-transporting ATPase subunit KdpC [Planctomycetota bacterium]